MKGIAELKMEVSANIPKHMKPLSRLVNPCIYEPDKNDFERMSVYFYMKSKCSNNSPLVAPKATKPFIRICEDN